MIDMRNDPLFGQQTLILITGRGMKKILLGQGTLSNIKVDHVNIPAVDPLIGHETPTRGSTPKPFTDERDVIGRTFSNALILLIVDTPRHVQSYAGPCTTYERDFGAARHFRDVSPLFIGSDYGASACTSNWPFFIDASTVFAYQKSDVTCVKKEWGVAF